MKPPDQASTGYLDDQERPVGASPEELDALIRKGHKLWYVWSDASAHCVPPESLPFLSEALRAQREKHAHRQMLLGFAALGIGAVLLWLLSSGSLRFAVWLLMLLLGVFPILDGLYQRFGVKPSGEAIATHTRFEYWLEQVPTPFTKGLIALLSALFVLQLLTGLQASITALGMAAPAIQDGAFWRLGTAMLLHGNIPHLLFNAYAIAYLSRRVEALGHWSSSAITFFTSALIGMLASYLFGNESTTSVGASGGICGLLGWLMVQSLRYPAQLPFAFAWPLLLGVLSLVSLGILLPNIDNLGHGAGFAAGVLLALLRHRGGPVHAGHPVRRTAGLLAAGLILGLAVLILTTLVKF